MSTLQAARSWAKTMYRGVDLQLPAEGVHQYIRLDRLPRDTGRSTAFNIAFNLVMEMQFNVQRIRRCSLFVTGSRDLAQSFAKDQSLAYVATVEPIGNYRFIWSPSVRDSKSLLERYQTKYLEAFSPWELAAAPRLRNDIDLTWADVESISHQLADSPARGFSWTDRSVADRLRDRMRQLTGLGKSPGHRYQDTDLPAALGSGHEVLLFDCPMGYRLGRSSDTQTADTSTAGQLDHDQP